MTNQNLEEMDLDSMSLDELDSLLKESEGKAEPNANNQEIEKEEIETSGDSEDQDNVDVESTPESGEDKPQEEDDEADIEPQYRGKTKRDILDMQRNANKKISQQNNELYHLKKKLEEQERFLAEQKTKAPNQEDDLLANYDDDDKKALRLIVQREIDERERSRQAQLEASRSSVAKAHDELWANLEALNPDLFNSIKEEAIGKMSANKETTYYQEGWLKEFIKSKASGYKTTSKAPVIKKKKVVTVGTGNNVSAEKINKPVSEMTASEYEKHILSQGIKF